MLKMVLLLYIATNPTVRKYAIIVEQTAGKPEKWWIAYKIAEEEETLGAILKTKNAMMNFKKATAAEGATTYSAYDGESDTIYMQVR